MLIFWSLVFVVSLVLLIKGADWFVESSEKIGLALKISPFIIRLTKVQCFFSDLPFIRGQTFWLVLNKNQIS